MAREALEQAGICVGEINTQSPCTLGDTFVHISEFDFLVRSTDPPIYFDRWETNEIWDQVALNTASLIEDGSCLAFSIGPLCESLAKQLKNKRHLGIHSPFFTDPLMDLIQSGAVTNRRKDTYRGKSLTSYALGTPDLMHWLDNNPLIDIAHPEDRANLVQKAKEHKILYQDQIFLAESARLYPADIAETYTTGEDLRVRFRAIRPSDEEGMRHLFYRFSEKTVYYRYFQTVRSMPHAKMQEYVNVDWNQVMSIVGLVGEEGKGRIIAEARYIKIPGNPLAEVVFVVDEKGELPVKAHLEGGVYHIEIPFNSVTKG